MRQSHIFGEFGDVGNLTIKVSFNRVSWLSVLANIKTFDFVFFWHSKNAKQFERVESEEREAAGPKCDGQEPSEVPSKDFVLKVITGKISLSVRIGDGWESSARN